MIVIKSEPSSRKKLSHLEAPLEDADVCVERKGLCRVLEADLVLDPEELLVDVGVRLQLDALLAACNVKW